METLLAAVFLPWVYFLLFSFFGLFAGAKSYIKTCSHNWRFTEQKDTDYWKVKIRVYEKTEDFDWIKQIKYLSIRVYGLTYGIALIVYIVSLF